MSKPPLDVKPIPVDPIKRKSLSVDDLHDREAGEIKRAEIPLAQRYSIKDLE
jgi:hypothetical protein